MLKPARNSPTTPDTEPARVPNGEPEHRVRHGSEEVLIAAPFMLLVVAHFLQALGYASMLLLPLYLVHLQASRVEIGAIMGTAAISGLLTRPLVGWALDTLGRKPTLIVGTIILAIALAMVGLIDHIGWLIYVERALLGVGLGALFTGYFTFAADLIPASRRTEGLALFGISGLLPLLVNPFTDQIGIEPPDLQWFFPRVGGLVALSILFLAFLSEPRKISAKRFSVGATLSALRRRKLWSVWLATAVFATMVAVFMTFATVTAGSRGVTQPASLWLSYALGAIAIRLFGARLPDRIGPANIVCPALACYVTGSFVAAGAQDLQTFLFAALLAGIGHGYCFPVLSGQVVSRTPSSVRGSALAMFTAVWGGAELIASPLFGAIADRHGDAFMFWLAGLCGIVALVFWAGLEHSWGQHD